MDNNFTDIQMKLYGKIGDFRLIDIEVFLNDDVIYNGRVEDASVDIKNLLILK